MRIVCKALLPIRYSRNDTLGTRRQIIPDNAAKAALCKNLPSN